VLFLHETHKVVGVREDDFEAAYRDGWMPTLAQGDDARLLLVHQPRPRFRSVLRRRLHHRDHRWCSMGAPGAPCAVRRSAVVDGEVDEAPHDVTGKLLLPVQWSPLQEIDLTTSESAGVTRVINTS
jgi:hypothetical protein